VRAEETGKTKTGDYHLVELVIGLNFLSTSLNGCLRARLLNRSITRFVSGLSSPKKVLTPFLTKIGGFLLLLSAIELS
jgi:hypothetical protein